MNSSNYQNRRGFLTMPVAILIAGVIIGAAIIYAVGKNNVQPPSVAGNTDNQPSAGAALVLDNLKPITADDHVRGNPVHAEFESPAHWLCGASWYSDMHAIHSSGCNTTKD